MTSEEERTKAVGLARYAADFLEVALAADDIMGKKTEYSIVAPIPVLYMMGQAIELYFKAFLRHKGLDLKDLRKIGHNLKKAHKKCKELGLNSVVILESDDIEVLEILNELYCTKQLNYIVTGAKTFPSFGPLESLAKKLDKEISPYVGYKARY